MKNIIFDIETAPLPEKDLAALIPAFDPAEVKTGNIKDPEKIAEKIKQCEADHRQTFMDKAALSAVSGRVLAVGFICDGEAFLIHGDDEQKNLSNFWDYIKRGWTQYRFVGFNIFGFDLPFLIRRSWKLGVPVPPFIRNGRYFSSDMVDLMDVWTMGNKDQRQSLDTVAKHLGCGEKNGIGKDFARIYSEDQEKALEYLRNDLRMTSAVCKKLLAP